MSQGLKAKKINERENVLNIFNGKKVAYSLSNPEWLIVVNEKDFVSGEEMADVQ